MLFSSSLDGTIVQWSPAGVAFNTIDVSRLAVLLGPACVPRGRGRVWSTARGGRKWSLMDCMRGSGHGGKP